MRPHAGFRPLPSEGVQDALGRPGGVLNRRLALLALLPLTGCGFELRREPELPFQTLALAGFDPGSPIAAALRRQLKRTPVQVVEDASRAQVVIEALRELRDRSVVASSSAGQVREWQLRLQFDYQLRNPAGELLSTRSELRLTRDMNFTETQALAKEQEAANLYGAMLSDAVAQVMRRLAAVRLPG